MKTFATIVAARGRSTRATARRSCALLAPAAGLAAALMLAAPASAAPFQQYLNGACTGQTCKIDFATVPAGKRLFVNSVSCYVRVVPAAPGDPVPEINFEQMLVVGANPNKVLNALTLAPAFTGRKGGETAYSANHAVTAFANAKQRFQGVVEIDQGSFSQFACHISGNMTKV